MGTTDAINKSNTPRNNKLTCTKKHRSHHPHHHRDNRPRSKSLDLHRHSTPLVHKKKHPHQYKHTPAQNHSPGGHPSVGTVASPSSPKLKGKMWIRPAAVRNSQIPFPPALPSTPLNGPSAAHQVIDASLPSPTSFDDEVMLYALPTSSFNSYQRQQGYGRPARIVFGQSGKPIKPRTAF